MIKKSISFISTKELKVNSIKKKVVSGRVRVAARMNTPP